MKPSHRTRFVRPVRSWFLIVALIASMLEPARSPGHDGEAAIHDLSPFRSCGLNCLFVVARWNGIDASLKSLGDELAPRENGESSISDLERASKKMGLDPISARVGMGALGTIPLPAIVQLKSRARQSDASHYVVLIGLHRQGVILIDPPAGATLHPYSEFADDWTGVVVAYSSDHARKDLFLSELRGHEPWVIWTTRSTIAASLGLLVWFLFVKRASYGSRAGHGSMSNGVNP